jgi:uncharacterized membrane protein (UPF0136 family)
MDKISLSALVAMLLAGLYGLTSLIGGIIGYVKADSKASLIAGGVSGLLLLIFAAGALKIPVVSLAGAIIVALALAGRFAPKALGLAEKAGGPVDYIMTIGAALVIISSALALLMRLGSSSNS